MVDKIVTLDDDREYCIISELDYEGVKHYCAVEYFEKMQDISKNYIVFKEYLEGDEVFLELVTDKKLSDYIIFKIGSKNDEKFLNA